eukprot:m.31188 g.31188  ORF g.31188 m.31188 type:complete len:95 (-) comp10674_c0_seq1:890-1174(-)
MKAMETHTSEGRTAICFIFLCASPTELEIPQAETATPSPTRPLLPSTVDDQPLHLSGLLFIFYCCHRYRLPSNTLVLIFLIKSKSPLCKVSFAL